jgi:hypothetical protein
MNVILVLTFAFAFAPTGPVGAQALDAASATALAATLKLLQDPTQRGAFIAGSPQAAAADQQMQAMLASRELQEEFYALAAAIFSEVVQGSGSDTSKMAQALAAGQADPAGFVARLSPGTAERLRAFAGKIADQKR